MVEEAQGIKLTADGGIVKYILSEGVGGTPKSKQQVAIFYTGKLPGGEVLDSSDEDPYKFVIGVGEVIRGWDIGIGSMRRGEKARFVIDCKYAYGEKGAPPKIPPNATVELEVELLDFHDKRRPADDLDNDEKESLAEECKVTGNAGFKDKTLNTAVYAYKEGINAIEHILESERNTATRKLWVSLHLNLCIALNLLANWAETKRYADRVIAVHADQPKAHYLRGIAEENMSLFYEAIKDLEVALKANPADEKVRLELEAAKKRKQDTHRKEKAAFSKLFQQPSEHTVAGPKYDPANPRVFMDIKIGTAEPRRVVIELFSKVVPKTAENFRCLCTGERSTPDRRLHYKGTKFHRIVKGFMMQGGDIVKGDGTGAISIYGEHFEDENFAYKHEVPGLLSMANSGANTNGSQFFVTFKAVPWIDGKHVVFGRVVKGMATIRAAEGVGTGINDVPTQDVMIVDCGEFKEHVSPENSV